MRYVSLLAAPLLGACAATPIDKFAAAGPALKGQPIGALYDRWGPFERVVPPDIARAVHKNDGFVYVWTSNYSATYSNSTTSMGTIGTTPFSITTTTPESATYYCTITVKTNEDRRIADVGMTGARAPCNYFADRL